MIMKSSCDQEKFDRKGTLGTNRSGPSDLHDPIDFSTIAEAGASVLNGPNGKQAIQALKIITLCGLGVVSFDLLLRNAPTIISCFTNAVT